MAYMYDLLKGMPEVEKMEAKKACVELAGYVQRVMKYVIWVINNLDLENFSDGVTEDIIEQAKEEITNLKDGYFNNIISSNIITQNLNAEYGNIAHLTVDELRTDYQRAYNYLKGDKSDINYIYIHDEEILFMTAVVNNSADEGIMFKSNGKQLYWYDTTKKAMTFEKFSTTISNDVKITKQREAVYVYNYSEYVKARIKFEPVLNPDGTATVQPIFTFGTGDVTGNGKAYLIKNVEGMNIVYKSRTDAKEYGVVFKDDGVYLRCAGLDFRQRPIKVCSSYTEAVNDNTLPVGGLYLVL